MISDLSAKARNRWVEYVVSGLIVIFPSIVATTYGGSSYIFSLLVLLGLIYGRGWKDLEHWERKILLGFVALFFAMALSLVNASDLSLGVAKLERFFRIGLTIPIYLLFRRFGLSLGKPLLIGVLIAVPVLLVQAIYQIEILGNIHAQGYYYKILFGDLTVLLAGILTVGWLTLGSNRTQLFLYVLAILLLAYLAVLSGSRGAWLFAPFLVFALAWMYRARVRAAVVVTLVFGAVGGLAFLSQVDTVQRGVSKGVAELELFLDNPAKGTSWGIRLNLWRNSLLLAQESPLLGVGLGDFQDEMKRLVSEGRSLSPAVKYFGQAHNIFFDVLAKAGILGLVAMVSALFVLPFLAFYRYWNVLRTPWGLFYSLGGVVVLLAFAVFGLSEGWLTRNPFVNSYVVFLAVFLSGLATSVKAESWDRSPVPN